VPAGLPVFAAFIVVASFGVLSMFIAVLVTRPPRVTGAAAVA